MGTAGGPETALCSINCVQRAQKWTKTPHHTPKLQPVRGTHGTTAQTFFKKISQGAGENKGNKLEETQMLGTRLEMHTWEKVVYARGRMPPR